eukprot:CAMPEP_0197452102 /NCGR_PEP_ID=MMETSP1175-20131217/31130_1 /TAXON_ID=1003142 /ORGANISM="Triceratium dubium, Strain CCMP147" /LENGTH=143 /DNA_ID=CAMNT_0042985017 /DNA_START=373 /DNA_END=805 /DNA_ORIENTATION=+
MKYYVNIFIALLVAATATGDETHDASMSTYEEEDLAWNAQLPEAMQDYQIKGGGRNGPLWLDYEDLAGEHMCLTVSNNTLSSDHNLRRELLKWDEVLTDVGAARAVNVAMWSIALMLLVVIMIFAIKKQKLQLATPGAIARGT